MVLAGRFPTFYVDGRWPELRREHPINAVQASKCNGASEAQGRVTRVRSGWGEVIAIYLFKEAPDEAIGVA